VHFLYAAALGRTSFRRVGGSNGGSGRLSGGGGIFLGPPYIEFHGADAGSGNGLLSDGLDLFIGKPGIAEV